VIENLHRVWSTDWWTDPEREMEKIEKASANRMADTSSATASSGSAEKQ
jgi:hypothetical protein